MRTTETTEFDSTEAEIKKLTDRLTMALHDKDIDRIMSLYSDDIILFDLAPPLVYAGIDAYRKNLEDWFPTFDGPIGLEITEQKIRAGDDVAIVHSVNHLTGRRTDGYETDVWLRATIGLRRIGGQWRIFHEHASVPFYMDGSDKAAIDLNP